MRRREFMLILGGAMTMARAPRAQQRKTAVIGFFVLSSASVVVMEGLRQGLSDTGYVDGQNLTIDYRWAEGHYDRLPALAAEFVGRKVDLILAAGSNLAPLAAKNATSTIPNIFVTGGDPVADGVVPSLARPGGNLTGFTLFGDELMAKRLEMISELVPRAAAIALLVNPKYPNTERVIRDTEEAARARGVRLDILKAENEREIDMLSQPLPNCMPKRSSLAQTPFLPISASNFSPWRPATKFRRFTCGPSLQWPAV